jgi:hypothetical protein
MKPTNGPFTADLEHLRPFLGQCRPPLWIRKHPYEFWEASPGRWLTDGEARRSAEAAKAEPIVHRTEQAQCF